MASFSSLPPELHIHVARFLAAGALSSLLQTCRGLCSILTPLLHQLGLQDHGRLALHHASAGRHYDLASSLLSLGADVDSVLHGMTPLQVAVAENDSRMVALLLSHCADVTYRHSAERTTALETAALLGNVGIAETLIDVHEATSLPLPPEWEGNEDVVLKAVAAGRQEMVDMLLSRGISAHILESGVKIAVSLGFSEVAVTLLKARIAAADDGQEDENTGDWVLGLSHQAARYANLEVLKALVDYGVDLDRERRMMTPVVVAARAAALGPDFSAEELEVDEEQWRMQSEATTRFLVEKGSDLEWARFLISTLRTDEESRRRIFYVLQECVEAVLGDSK